MVALSRRPGARPPRGRHGLGGVDPARSVASAAEASACSEHGHRLVGTPRPAVPHPVPRQYPASSG